MAESYTAPPNLCLWPKDASEQSRMWAKKGLFLILARYHSWARWHLHQIALAVSPRSDLGARAALGVA
jgi:hypothetical protein